MVHKDIYKFGYVWTCDHCGEEYAYKKDAVKHEHTHKAANYNQRQWDIGIGLGYKYSIDWRMHDSTRSS